MSAFEALRQKAPWLFPFFKNAIRDILTVRITDVSTAASHWIVAPHAGKIVKWYSVLEGGGITAADATLTLELAGTLVTGSSITIAQSGSAAGDVDSATPTAANAVTAGQAIEVITNGGSSTARVVNVTIEIERT